VGTAVDAALGVADADAEAEVDAACDVLPAAWLLLVDDVQPATDNEATITSTRIANNFFIIQATSTLGLSLGTGMIVALRPYLLALSSGSSRSIEAIYKRSAFDPLRGQGRFRGRSLLLGIGSSTSQNMCLPPR
jgi:hypothetical protein